MSKLAVVALGGNAFTVENEAGRYEDQARHAAVMAELIGGMLDDGWLLALVHGNGPQVGNLAIQQEDGADLVPAQPLFSLVAMTQGELGSLITLAVRNATGRTDVTGVLSHVVVDQDDAAFAAPSKPIGPFLTEQEAHRLATDRGWHIREDSGRGWRRIVASPRPVRITEVDAIRQLLRAGHVVVTGGGGGIPVVRGVGGEFECTDAVIDKDYVAAELAVAVGAQALVIVTAIDAVQLDFGTPRQRPIAQMELDEAECHLAQGQFPEGSMGPKIRASTYFLRHGGEVAVITTAALAARGLRCTDPDDSSAGTRLVHRRAATSSEGSTS
ncbi:carbamate kinase [Leekyejoonella antrihumi]|uniref:carbamate kinase n=1 Tax=Leekyejoonella antrihumi TaxID=1660198 RepID=UPI0016480847|nr:carbamate kinase [Leekyejoonella antrihumi]